MDYTFHDMSKPTISFITANFVGRALEYRGPDDWMPHDAATINSATPDSFLEVVQDVVVNNFDAIDIWTAHCHWKHHDRGDFLEQVKGYCSQFDLTITSYAGGIQTDHLKDLEAPFRFMKQLGAPIFAGGIWTKLAPAQFAPAIDDVCRRLGVRWACENHPEKTVDEMIERIDGGKHERVGIALDTGWCGTHGLDALEAVQRVHEKGKLFIVHLKDVTEGGKHVTCTVGDGVVPCEKVVQYLSNSGWRGNISIEHEPYNRDPMPEVVESARRVREWLR
jgi:sugar phosphate isomerase/epimerase